MAWYKKSSTWITILGAIILWVYVSLNDSYQMIVEVPLVITSPEGRAVEDILPSNISADITGAGWVLLNYNYFSSSKICKVNLNKVEQNGEYYTITDVDLQKGIEGLNKIRVRRFYPNSMKIKTSEIIKKEMPINPVIELNLRDGFVLVGDIKTSPTSVTITGNKKLLDSINIWNTKKSEVYDVNKSFAYTVSVSDSLSSVLKIDPNIVTIYGSVEQYSEKTFEDIELKIIGGTLPDNELISPFLFDVTISGGIDLLNKLTASDITISLNYDDIINDSIGVLFPKITLPPYVKLINTLPRFVIHRKIL